METRIELTATPDQARDIFIRHHARYEVSPYFVLLDRRTLGAPSHLRVHAGYDVELYGNSFDHGAALSLENSELREALNELEAACREATAHAADYSSIEIIPWNATLVLNVKSHLEPEALVTIRITHSRGLDQPAGSTEERALADVVGSLHSRGVRKT
jgi:hypothetical protein